MEETELSTIDLEEARLTPDPVPRARYGLVVDDDPLVADTVAAILRCYGYAVSVVYDGVELAVRLHELVPVCKILLFSGQPEEALRLANAISPAIQFTLLAKPLKPEELLQELGRVQS